MAVLEADIAVGCECTVLQALPMWLLHVRLLYNASLLFMLTLLTCSMLATYAPFPLFPAARSNHLRDAGVCCMLYAFLASHHVTSAFVPSPAQQRRCVCRYRRSWMPLPTGTMCSRRPGSFCGSRTLELSPSRSRSAVQYTTSLYRPFSPACCCISRCQASVISCIYVHCSSLHPSLQFFRCCSCNGLPVAPQLLPAPAYGQALIEP